MEDFNWRGRQLTCWATPGVVLSTEKRSETHIQSSGGGVVHGQHHSTYIAPTVSSKNITKHEFWYRPDGRAEEVAVKLTGIDIPLRENQSIVMVYAGRKGAKTSVEAILINRSANTHYFLANTRTIDKACKLGVWSGQEDMPEIIASGIGGVVLFLLLGVLGNGTFLAFVGCLLASAFIVTVYRARQRRVLLRKWLESCAQESYSVASQIPAVTSISAAEAAYSLAGVTQTSRMPEGSPSGAR